MTPWDSVAPSMSLLPYRDVLYSVFNAPSQEARWWIIGTNYAALTRSATFDAFELDIERSWSQGDRSRADFLWRIERLLQRVRDIGLNAAVELYTQPIEQVRDITVLLERSPTPFQTLKGITEIMAAVTTSDENAVYRILSEYIDQFRQPLCAAYVRIASRNPELSSEIGFTTLEQTAQLLDALSHGQDPQTAVSNWRLGKQESLEEMEEPRRTVGQFLTTADWHAAQLFVKLHYNVILSSSALDVLRGIMRNAWQSDRVLGQTLWRYLRLLEHSRMLGIDAAFDNLIWSSKAESFWHSDREVRMMEAANIPLGDLKSLAMLFAALDSTDELAIHGWAAMYWNEIQNPLIASYVRYMAEVARVESNVDAAATWEELASWLDEIRGEDSEVISRNESWSNIPNISGLALL